MSVSANTLALLMANGVTGDALLEIVRSIEADNGPARSSGAERQRRYRARQRGESDVTGDVTQLRNEGDVSPPILDKESFPQTPFKEINPTPEHTHRARGPVFVCPAGVDPQHWSDFLANRKRKNLTNTETAYAGQLRLITQFADDEWPPGKLVQLAAEKGWGTIVNPRESEQRNGGRLVQREAATPGLGRTQVAVLDVKARLRSAMATGADRP